MNEINSTLGFMNLGPIEIIILAVLVIMVPVGFAMFYALKILKAKANEKK